MPTLRPRLKLWSIRNKGRNFQIDFNMLQILPEIPASFFANCKKMKRRFLSTRAALFSIFGRTQFFIFLFFEHKKASPQNIVSTHTSSTPHMVNFQIVLKETRPMHSSCGLLYFITAWILLIRFAARLVPSENLIVFLLKN